MVVGAVGPFRLTKPIGWLICLEMPVANAPVCEWMYIRNVNKVHLPCFWIVAVDAPLRRRAMMPPAWRE